MGLNLLHLRAALDSEMCDCAVRQGALVRMERLHLTLRLRTNLLLNFQVDIRRVRFGLRSAGGRNVGLLFHFMPVFKMCEDKGVAALCERITTTL
jgi:hypothetical protein